jgi:hypothetical protein
MHVGEGKGQRIIAIRRPWFFRLLKAIDGSHFQESIPDDAEMTDMQYDPLSQTLIITVSSESYKNQSSDGYMLSTTVIFGD